MVRRSSMEVIMPLFNRVRMTFDEWRAKQAARGFSDDNALEVDGTPIAPPLGYKRQPTMVEHIRNMVRSEQLRQAAEAAGAETFDEADDFAIDDDPVPMSGYENEPHFDPAEVREMQDRVDMNSRLEADAVYQEQLAAARKRIAEATTPAAPAAPRPNPEPAA